jgi:tyrosine aminotransferase
LFWIDSFVRSQTANGYQPSTGSGAARKAIAQVSNISDCPITEDDVIICSGCSGALELAITVLVNEGTFQNFP